MTSVTTRRFASALLDHAPVRSHKTMEKKENLRLAEFARINPIATASEASFNIITRLVQQIFDVPAVAITLIDHDTQYLSAPQGIDAATIPRSDSICDIVVSTGQTLVIGDTLKDSRVQDIPAVSRPMGLRFYAGAPLTTIEGQHLGALCVLDGKPRRFSSDQINLLVKFASLVSDQFELRALADRDFLTNTLNRRGFDTALKCEMDLIGAGGPSATLAMLDLDHFKSVNDTYGHPVGDKALKSLAELISDGLRQVDHFARLGGEEFALLLPRTRINTGNEVVNRLRKAVADFRMDGYPDLAMTISIGLVDITRQDWDSEIVMRDVDAAVYAAKSGGRNRTITFPQDHPKRNRPLIERRVSKADR